MNEMPEMLEIEEVSEILGVKPNCIYRYHAAGLIRSRHNRLIRCTRDDVLDCLNRMGTPEFKRRIAAHLHHKKLAKGRPSGSDAVRRLRAEGKL